MNSCDSSEESEEFDINFSPKHFLRCHSKHRKDAADVQTNVWECAFHPLSFNNAQNGEQTNIVATCGGNSICFIDIETGKVLKKYYASKSGENFFTLSWTRIKGYSILVAGGAVQTINFINYDEGYCFHEEKFDRSVLGVKVGITSLKFHPIVNNILYCSCSNGKILVMDIGTPTVPDFSVDLQILQQYEVHCEVFLLVYYLDKELILGTSDDGIYCWQGNPELMGTSKANHRVLLQFPGRPLALTNAPSLVDTVEVLENGLIASKCALRGAIYIWNIDKVIKGSISEDVTLRITPLYQLEWSDTDNYFMYLGYDRGCKYLACGDDKGAIWSYDIKHIIKNPDPINTDPTQMIKPTTIFEWPNLEDAYASRKRKLNLNVYDIVINKTILSYNSEYLVAVTNKNMVCIWKKKKSFKIDSCS